MRRRIFLITVVSAGLIGIGLAAVAENHHLELVRSAFGSGGEGQSQSIVLTSIVTPSFAATPAPQSDALELWAGFLAPASDQRGLITPGRLAGMLLGREVPPEPIAADFAGNRDGRLDVADVIRLNNKQVR